MTLYLAKIIGPTEFGIASILGVIYYLGLSVADSGMSNSLMRTKNCNDTDYSTVLMTNIFFGIVIYLFILLITPFASNFYAILKLTYILPVYGIGILLSSIKSVYVTYEMKNFEYKKMFLLNMPGSLIASIVAIILGRLGFGIWSIISLFLINQLISLVLFIAFSGWKTKFVLDKAKFKTHFNFGYKISISSFINTLFENIYQLIIGKYFSIRMTGIYDRAYTLGNYPISILSTVLSKVTLPIFVNYTDDLVQLRSKFRNAIKLVFFTTCFVVGALLIVIPSLLHSFMGPQWEESINIFKILCLGLVLYPIHSMNINVLNVYGRSDLLLKLEIIKKFLQIFLIFVFYKYGIFGLVYSIVFHSYISLVINLYYTNKLLGYSFINQFMDLFPTLIGSIITILISIYIFNGHYIGISLLSFQILVYIILFSIVSYYIDRVSFNYIKENILVSIINKIKIF